MSAPAISAPQLRAVLERATKRYGSDKPVVIDADPASATTIAVDGTQIDVVGTASPLELRALVADHEHGDGPQPLVVVTDLERAELGSDLVQRLAGARTWRPDRWEAVKDLFDARGISARLAEKAYLADALIEYRPTGGYRPLRGPVLDVDTAVGELLRVSLDIEPDIADLAALMAWAADPTSVNRLRRLGDDVANEIDTALIDRYGPGARVLLTLARQGKADAVVPLALVGALIHADGIERNDAATTHLSYEVNQAEITPEQWRDAGRAAERRADDTTIDEAMRRRWLTEADAYLTTYGAAPLARHSDLLPSGFDQRLDDVAATLAAWLASPHDRSHDVEAMDAISRARRHHVADPVRVDRSEMASRMIRRGNDSIAWGGTLAEAAMSYRTDGAWWDRARVAVSRGESHTALAATYRTLTERADATRHDDNRHFAPLGAHAAGPLPDGVLGIEDVLSAIVAPIAQESGVLLVVLDGMGWPTFSEIDRELTRTGWSSWRDAAGKIDTPAVAALPTVTEVSRTSLLAGTIRRGTYESERRAFTQHRSLLEVSRRTKPPLIFHKVDLRNEGLDAVPDAVIPAIEDPDQRVVAVVLNNIDERLKDVVQPPSGWGLEELDPLGWLLAAARTGGKTVVVTSDHGHILDRNAAQRAGAGGGERWRPGGTVPGDDEIEVSGPRVETPDRMAILPWAEQVHYGTRRNGYHGGLTPQELLVPLAVYAIDAPADDWQSTALAPPPWWHRQPATAEATPAPPIMPKPKPYKAEPTLFDEPTDVQPSPTSAPTWVDRAVEALADHRRPQIRLTDDEVRVLLRVLEAQGGQPIADSRLADLSGLSPARITRYVSQLQLLVNIDGYGVVSRVGDDVRFDQALLDRQLGLD